MPEPGDDAHWVNLTLGNYKDPGDHPSANVPQPGKLGRVVQLTARANRPRAKGEAARVVVWKVEAVGGDNVDPKYLSSKDRARLRFEETKDNAKGEFRNTLYLPPAGGERYKVTVHRKDKPQQKIFEKAYTTWRKIYCSVHWVADHAPPPKGTKHTALRTYEQIKGKFVAAFREAYIDLEEVLVSKSLKGHENIEGTNSLKTTYRDLYPLQYKPQHLRIVFVHNLTGLDSKLETVCLTKTHAKISGNKAGGYAFEIDAPGKTLARQGENFVNLLLFDRHDTGTGQTQFARFTAAKTNWDSLTAIEKLETPEPNRDDYVKPIPKRAATRVDDHTIRVNLKNTEANEALDSGDTVDFHIVYQALQGGYEGHSIGNFLCTRIANNPTSILQTFTHEVGHGFQQAVHSEPTYDANGGASGTEDHPQFYTNDKGGQGPHCGTNAKTTPSAHTTSGLRMVFDNSAPHGFGGKLCTMYHADEPNVDADGKFCPDCVARLKRVDLSAKNMRNKGWEKY